MDGNGEPLVVYHQTGNDFTVFDTKHTGVGEFDSEYEQKYENAEASEDEEYSKSGLKESINKQGNITTNYTDFAKMLTVFGDVIKNAVPIEVHTDNYVGTKKLRITSSRVPYSKTIIK